MINAPRGDGGREARFSQCVQSQTLPRPRRRLLRVAAQRLKQDTIQDNDSLREPFAFAGLWETWRDPSDELVRSCAIITTTANSLLKPIHDRMPVILPREREELWLDHNVQVHHLLGSALAPYPADAMEAYEVSSLVNSIANNGPSWPL